MSKKFKVNIGINYPPEKRAEPGDVVDDIPTKSVKWLLERGAISHFSEGEKSPLVVKVGHIHEPKGGD